MCILESKVTGASRKSISFINPKKTTEANYVLVRMNLKVFNL